MSPEDEPLFTLDTLRSNCQFEHETLYNVWKGNSCSVFTLLTHRKYDLWTQYISQAHPEEMNVYDWTAPWPCFSQAPPLAKYYILEAHCYWESSHFHIMWCNETSQPLHFPVFFSSTVPSDNICVCHTHIRSDLKMHEHSEHRGEDVNM